MYDIFKAKRSCVFQTLYGGETEWKEELAILLSTLYIG